MKERELIVNWWKSLPMDNGKNKLSRMELSDKYGYGFELANMLNFEEKIEIYKGEISNIVITKFNL